MAFNISDFRAKLVGGGARSNMFEVIMTPPAYVGLNVEQFAFMCKATSQPSSTVGRIPLSYMGRPVFLGGDRQVETWQVTVINDETFDLRNAFEKWSTSIASHTTDNNSQRSLGAASDSLSYVGRATVQQLSKTGQPIKRYNLRNVWPIAVSGITMAWEQTDQIEEFGVELSFDSFDTDDNSVV